MTEKDTQGYSTRLTKWEREVIIAAMQKHFGWAEPRAMQEFDKILEYVENGNADKHTMQLVDEQGWRPLFLDEDEALLAYRRFFGE